MNVITDEKRAQVFDRIVELGVTAEIAQELESMEYFYYEDRNKQTIGCSYEHVWCRSVLGVDGSIG